MGKNRAKMGGEKAKGKRQNERGQGYRVRAEEARIVRDPAARMAQPQSYEMRAAAARSRLSRLCSMMMMVMM